MRIGLLGFGVVGRGVYDITKDRDDIKVVKVDVDENPELARQFQVMSIPALFVVKDGQVTESVIGYRSKEEILKMFG